MTRAGAQNDMLDSDEILAAGEEGDELHRCGAADVGEDGYRWDGDGDGNRGVGDVAADDPGGYRGEEEHVDEVHAEGQPCQTGDEDLLPSGSGTRSTSTSTNTNTSTSTSSCTLPHPYATEHQEKSEGLYQDVRRAEGPRPFYLRGRDKDSRGSFQPEGPGGEGASDEEA